MPGTNTSAQISEPCAKHVRFTNDTMTVELADGRSIMAPLAWYPRLFRATPAQREHFQISPAGLGIHWPDVDEDLSVDSILKGQLPPRKQFERHGMTMPVR